MLNSAVDINHELNRLLRFALSRGLIGPLAANVLIGELGVTDFSPEPCLQERPEENFEAILTPTPILERVLDWAVEAGLTPDMATDHDLLDTRLMGALAPRPSWTAATEYGELDITINLPKPEKDPREIARARTAALSSYP